MIGHIYGRISVITSENRPHMFVNELKIYVDYLKKELEKNSAELPESAAKYFSEFRESLIEGIDYYLGLGEKFIEEKKEQFIKDMNYFKAELENISLAVMI